MELPSRDLLLKITAGRWFSESDTWQHNGEDWKKHCIGSNRYIYRCSIVQLVSTNQSQVHFCISVKTYWLITPRIRSWLQCTSVSQFKSVWVNGDIWRPANALWQKKSWNLQGYLVNWVFSFSPMNRQGKLSFQYILKVNTHDSLRVSKSVGSSICMSFEL